MGMRGEWKSEWRLILSGKDKGGNVEKLRQEALVSGPAKILAPEEPECW